MVSSLSGFSFHHNHAFSAYDLELIQLREQKVSLNLYDITSLSKFYLAI